MSGWQVGTESLRILYFNGDIGGVRKIKKNTTAEDLVTWTCPAATLLNEHR